ncbi:hypothetical protein [Virgibacillus sp. L01]|uniref:hypothetical protein n=1 Tax=Virgibacillus sp. L01 TaxID=3457429 RepID=UPI003FD3CDD4
MALRKVKRPILESEKAKAEQEKEETVTQKKMEEANMENETIGNQSLGENALNPTIYFNEEGTPSFIRQANISEGKYEYRIDKTYYKENVKTKLGVKNQFRVAFSIYSKELGEKKMSMTFNVSSHPQSQLIKFLTPFNAVFSGKKITMNDLVGLTGVGRIYHKYSSTGSAYEKLEVLHVTENIKE